MYSADIRNSSSVADKPALQQHRLAQLAGLLQQREILHVARADLDHVRPLGHQFQPLVVHGFGHNAQAEALANLRHDAQRFQAQPLKCIRRGARLVSAAAEKLRAGRGHLFGNREGLIPAFNRTWPGDDGQVVSADGGVRSGETDDGVFFLHVPAGQLVGLGNANHFGDPGKLLQVAAFHFALVAGDADGGALGSGKRVGTETQLLNVLADRLDLFRCRLRFHHNQHSLAPKPPVYRLA